MRQLAKCECVRWPNCLRPDIIPLTTKLIDNAEPIRMRIKSKDKLKDDSDLVITHIRAIDNSRFIEKLTILNYEQMQKVKELLNEIVQ